MDRFQQSLRRSLRLERIISDLLPFHETIGLIHFFMKSFFVVYLTIVPIDSDDEVRVVKSAKDRVLDAIQECVNKVNKK